jgi:hypothetical protein
MKRLIPVLLTAAGLAASLGAQATTPTPAYTGGLVSVTQNDLIQPGTTIPEGYVVYCLLTILSVDASSTNTETIVSQATVSGNTASCTQNIYWWWYLSTETSDTVTITYGTGIGPAGLTSTAGLTRAGSHSLLSVPLYSTTSGASIYLTVADKLNL